jgi:hypothetical protein
MLLAAVVGVAVWLGLSLRAARARSVVLSGDGHDDDGARYLIYFTGEGCTVCKTHQEPALRQLDGIRIDKVDALAEADLARRFQVYTLPTTIVMSSGGEPLHVNYGYASASKLKGQLAV